MVRIALPSVQCARAVAAARASRAARLSCAGHNGFRTCSTTATAVPFKPGGEIAGLSPNISVKRTPVNRLRSSKRCGRRRLPQALGAVGSIMMFARTKYLYILASVLIMLAVPAASTAKQSAAVQSGAFHGCNATPILIGQPWRLEYRFGDTFAPGIGALDVVVHSTGATVVTAKRRDRAAQVKQLQLPSTAIAKFAKVLAASPPACVHSLQRGRYTVFDMRTIEISFTTPSFSTSAWVGPAMYVDNSKAFGALCNAVAIVKPYLGNAATWSATKLTPIRGEPCDIEASAPNNSVKRTTVPLRGPSAAYLGR